ncbi:SLAP domain-containing protein [Companilactobacillus allii]|uniref:Uncharacterized protein n=1 Tax=Companilactobacillus allii TaxID=1847728 RepID=A0A1P8Q2Y9_9LACO|nr:SLAP domain-containing protein [Companilactobacillus allii]APX72169.1 hypothetical protein BTM29_06180 [Companilactobacillus allii]USQ69266.1 SLAP domain-containing protein [Companilactobacillus allii]
MKKRIMAIVFAMAMIPTNIGVVQASSETNSTTGNMCRTNTRDNMRSNHMNLAKYDGKDVVIVENDPKSDSRTVGLYKKENGKLVYTGKRVNQVKGKSMQLWKADKVSINGKTCWQIGDNLYLKSSRVAKINMDKMKGYGQEASNFGNYPETNTASESDTVHVNNLNGDYVPVMTLQKDGSFAESINRSLENDTDWQTDKVRKYNGNIYCRVASNEWVNATDYVVTE